MFVPDFSSKLTLEQDFYKEIVSRYFKFFLDSDIVKFDLSSDIDGFTTANIVARSNGVMAGGEELVLLKNFFYDLSFNQLVLDGESFENGAILFQLSGSVSSILKSERLILNFLTRFTSIALKAKIYTDFVKYNFTNSNIGILCTRKGILSILDKKAASLGGVLTHRLNLAHAAMFKDNHFEFNSGYLNLDFSKYMNLDFLEFEFDNLQQLQSNLSYIDYSLKNGPNFGVLLDNFNEFDLNGALLFLNSNFKSKRFFVEVSGGINLGNIKKYDLEGIDYISTSDLYFYERPVDLSLELDKK